MPTTFIKGAAGPAFALTNQSITSNHATSPYAAYTVRRNGEIGKETTEGGSSLVEYWVDPRSSAVCDAFEVRVTMTSGTLSAGTSGSWLALTSDRDFSVSMATNGTKAATFTVEIRYASGAVVASATITLTANNT